MKKFLKDVVTTLVILGFMCVAFYRIGWVTNWKEIVTLFAIALIVIVVNKAVDILILRIRSRKR